MSLNPRRALNQGATITQLGREFGVTARALRYYEEQGLLSPSRRQYDARIYSHKDRVRLRLILQGRKVGLSLREIRELLDLYDKQGPAAQRASALPKLRAQVAALERRRGELASAIETLRAAVAYLAQATSASQAQGAP